jgi:hypothetical protein
LAHFFTLPANALLIPCERRRRCLLFVLLVLLVLLLLLAHGMRELRIWRLTVVQ